MVDWKWQISTSNQYELRSFHIRAVMTLAEMWSRRLLIVSIYGLGQVAPTRANNCLDTFPAVLNEQASLEEFFYSVFVFGTLLLGISNERPLSRSENTAREHWILDKFMSFTENHESVTFVGTALKIFCSLQCFCCDIYLVVNHERYSSRNRGARKCVGHKFGF